MTTKEKMISVESIMTHLPLETAAQSKSVHDVAMQMNSANKGSVIIVDDKDRPLGIITERDIVRKVVAQGKDASRVTAGEVMSKPLISVDPEVNIYDAALVMTKYRIRRLPAVRDNELLGIVTATDFARHLYENNKKDPMLRAMSRFVLIEHA